MSDITPASIATAIRFLQEKVVFFSLGVAVFSIFVSAVSVTWSITRTMQIQRDMTALEDEVSIYRVRYANWVALMKTKNIELEE